MLRKRKAILLAVTAIGLGCGRQSNEDAAASHTDSAVTTQLRPGRRAGIVHRKDGNFRFTGCSSTDTIAFEPKGQLPGVVRSAVGDSASEARVFMLIGFAGPAGGDTSYYATRDTFECHSDWTSFDYRATGDRPGWVAEVKGSALHVRRQGKADTTFTVIGEDSRAHQKTFEARASGVRLRLTGGHLCPNASTGAASFYIAFLTIEGQTLTGCAVPGLNKSVGN